MQIFQQNIKVTKDDLDELNHVNNVRYIQWINDVAKAHWLNKATSNMLNDYVWVVLKHQIEYKGAAFLNEILKLKTYVIHIKGATSTRVVEIYNKGTNKLLVKSETNFCLLFKESQKPTRITPEITELFN